MLKKLSFLLLSFLFLTVIFSVPVQAVCPVCTVAVCAGVGLARWLKVDDVISGIWIGGLIVSSFTWFLNWLKSKKLSLKIHPWLIGIAYYLLTVSPLFFTKIIGHPQNKICFFNKIFVDRLLFGIISGSLIFILGVRLHDFMKSSNNGKSYFPFQKVVVPILSLVILSVIFFIFK